MARRTAAGRRLAVVGAAGLLLALFLPWSRVRGAPPAFGIAPEASAWQVYSAAGVVLAVISIGVVGAAFRGRPRSCLLLAAAAGVALAFSLHARAHPPTAGLTLAAAGAYEPDAARAGAGETVAAIGAGLSLLGLIVGAAVPAAASSLEA